MLIMERPAVLRLSEGERDFYLDQAVVLHKVSWEQYVALADAREDGRPRFIYLDGELEIVTHSAFHELVKSLGRRLVEAYAEERDVELVAYGNTTFRKKVKRAGLEPDECYSLGRAIKTDKRGNALEPPDLAIETIYTSGSVDKLEIYRRLGVREVWFWIEDGYHLYRLHGEGYRQLRASVAVPGVDLARIARLILRSKTEKQTSVVRAYRSWLRSH